MEPENPYQTPQANLSTAVEAQRYEFGAYRSPRGRTNLLLIFLGLIIALEVLLSFLFHGQAKLLESLQTGDWAGRENSYMEVANASDSRVQAVAILYLAMMLGTAIVWCFWAHRISANAWSGGYPMVITPGWAVGWFFIPIANLWKPCQAMSESWAATNQAGMRSGVQRSAGLLGIWWAVWIIRGIVGQVINRMYTDTEQLPGLIDMSYGLMIDSMLGTVAGVVAFCFVRTFCRFQEEVYEGKGGSAATFNRMS